MCHWQYYEIKKLIVFCMSKKSCPLSVVSDFVDTQYCHSKNLSLYRSGKCKLNVHIFHVVYLWIIQLNYAYTLNSILAIYKAITGYKQLLANYLHNKRIIYSILNIILIIRVI